MKYTFLTASQLTKDCPVGYAILGIAEMNNPKGYRWELDMVAQDEENENLFHSDFSIPGIPGSCLSFTYESLPHQLPAYQYRIVKKTGTLP